MTANNDPSLSVLQLRVRFGETDLMGIVHHASHLSYFEAGRVEWLRRRGLTYADWAARGMHLPVVEVGVRYRAPARFDDLLAIETRLTMLRTVSLRFDYRMLRGAELLAEGFTKLASIDEKHALRRIPEEVISVLRGGEGPSVF